MLAGGDLTFFEGCEIIDTRCSKMRYVIEVGTVIPAKPPTSEDNMDTKTNEQAFARIGNGEKSTLSTSSSTSDLAERFTGLWRSRADVLVPGMGQLTAEL